MVVGTWLDLGRLALEHDRADRCRRVVYMVTVDQILETNNILSEDRASEAQ